MEQLSRNEPLAGMSPERETNTVGEEQSTLFSPDFNRSIQVEAREERLTSDAGALLLREVFSRLARWRMSSDLILKRHVLFPPTGAQRFEIGGTRLESDGFSYGYGWNAGLLHKPTPSFSWGLSYRSRIEVDYDGNALFTQRM